MGADPNAPDNVGCTPLHFAAQSDSVDVVHILIDAGADVNALSEDKHTPPYCALLNTRAARYAIAEALLAAGADPRVDAAAAARIFRCITITGDELMNNLLVKDSQREPTVDPN